MLLMHELYGTGPRTPTGVTGMRLLSSGISSVTYQVDCDPTAVGITYGQKPTARRHPCNAGQRAIRWTESYHQGRALMNVSETLKRLATGEKRK